MKKSLFLCKAVLIFSLLNLVGCSSDPIINNDTTFQTNTVNKSLAGDLEIMEVLIEYEKGTNELIKSEIRLNYKKHGFLSWEKCKLLDDNFEIWTVDAELFNELFNNNRLPAVVTNTEDEDVGFTTSESESEAITLTSAIDIEKLSEFIIPIDNENSQLEIILQIRLNTNCEE